MFAPKQTTYVGLTVADKRVVTILGVVPVFITTRRAISKEGVHTRQLLYIVKELKRTFISRDALQDLGVVSEYFPQVPPVLGRTEVAEVSAMEHEAGVVRDSDLGEDRQAEVAPCGGQHRRRQICSFLLQKLIPEGRVNHKLMEQDGSTTSYCGQKEELTIS